MTTCDRQWHPSTARPPPLAMWLQAARGPAPVFPRPPFPHSCHHPFTCEAVGPRLLAVRPVGSLDTTRVGEGMPPPGEPLHPFHLGLCLAARSLGPLAQGIMNNIPFGFLPKGVACRSLGPLAQGVVPLASGRFLHSHLFHSSPPQACRTHRPLHPVIGRRLASPSQGVMFTPLLGGPWHPVSFFGTLRGLPTVSVGFRSPSSVGSVPFFGGAMAPLCKGPIASGSALRGSYGVNTGGWGRGEKGGGGGA